MAWRVSCTSNVISGVSVSLKKVAAKVEQYHSVDLVTCVLIDVHAQCSRPVCSFVNIDKHRTTARPHCNQAFDGFIPHEISLGWNRGGNKKGFSPLIWIWWNLNAAPYDGSSREEMVDLLIYKHCTGKTGWRGLVEEKLFCGVIKKSLILNHAFPVIYHKDRMN